MLSAEFRAAYNLPFLNVLHDGCTTGSGKKGLVGTSASFINLSWEFVNTALLVTVYNGSHESCKIKMLITSRIKEFYGIDIKSITQFTMSDTAPSAKKVSKLFEDSLPTDCAMHVLNLCLVYGMGMRENYETVYLLDPTTNKPKKERRLCTVGGPFTEGATLIKKVRSLNNYFNSPQRTERLAKLQQFYCLPELKPIVDCDTRVASSVTLFQRTIVNYPAFKAYFQHCESYDDPAVFEKFTFSEWRLLVEVEAITQSLADLARIDVQRSNQVSSDLIVLMKFALDRLATDTFHIYDLDAARPPKPHEKSLPRNDIQIGALSEKAMICVNRIKGQVLKRLPTLTDESVVILLLDPRTKFTVDSLIQPPKLRQEAVVGGVVSDEGSNVTAGLTEDEGQEVLRNAHREVFRAIHASNPNNSLHTDVDTPTNLDLVPSVDDKLVMCGAPLVASSSSSTPVASLHDQADEVLAKWYQHSVNWVPAALQQASDDQLTEADFTKSLLVRRRNDVCWNLQALCEHIDICHWYRETGAATFPTIAALTRVWLGRSPSNAFQERVFSTGAFVMGPPRTSTDNRRAETQVLMMHNRAEIRRMEHASVRICEKIDHATSL
ncbi:hypothetical protein L915_16667 [Phytophthora nicotianae]|uniref:HAT C-terminal dimerisation domain-containing protein n=1 Tax=Phytophthora nicotianae TaxID=4792 RepID=W2G274_PHYNI|nr:hypothetical protein L915_16667 [Phytophthora nicotianae]ETL30460.1 hypothetical protein L916_16572 [Phytophthora nicotianae]ETM36892.1 hypothetical protein L914_16502 [Phytophthora nicotianae]